MTAAATPVNIADLKNAPAPREARLPAVTPGFGDLQSFELMQRGAKVLAASSLVPKEYQGAEGLPNAIVALNMALRMQADPLMVMQNLYVVHGRPSWSAQFLIAAFNRCGRYSALRYEWQGKRGDKDWGCRAWAIEIASGDRITGPLVTMATADAEGWTNRSGSKWKTIPELMLTYRAAAWLVRTNAPEIAMGLPTQDEAEDMVTLTRDEYSVESLRSAAPAPDALSFAYVMNEINTAESLASLDEARELIAQVTDAQQRAELDVAERAKRKQLPPEGAAA